MFLGESYFAECDRIDISLLWTRNQYKKIHLTNCNQDIKSDEQEGKIWNHQKVMAFFNTLLLISIIDIR